MKTISLRLLALVLGAHTVLKAEDGDRLMKADLAALQNPATRTAEAARLAGCDGEKRLLTGFRWLEVPQRAGAPSLHLLTAAYHFAGSTYVGISNYVIERPEELFATQEPAASPDLLTDSTPGLDPVRDSVILVFDAAGNEIRPFGGNNYATRDYFRDFNGDGILDRAYPTNYGVKEAPGYEIEALTLRSLESEPRDYLKVIFNWHPRSASAANEWTFACYDEDGDGFVEIAFGPVSTEAEGKSYPFVFRWDPVKKEYSGGEIPAGSHIRVMQAGEKLSDIAAAGGLGYPLLDEPGDANDDNTIAAAPPEPKAAFVYQSLTDASADEVAGFFQGAPHRDSFSGPADAGPNQVPDGFWQRQPKDAALALADGHRANSHRLSWQLAVDDRGGIAPPTSGWLVHDWNSSSCYSFSSRLFALRFGVSKPVLMVIEYNTIGVVGRNPWADQPAHGARIIELSEKEARFLADTLFWLDRVRSRPAAGVQSEFGGTSSTADGSATQRLFPDEAPASEVATETVWAISSIASRWTSGYDRETFINLAHFLFAEALPAHLGERWMIAPAVDAHSLATPTEKRVAPRLDSDAREQLAETFLQILRYHADSPIPAMVLRKLASAAGEEALTSLLPSLEGLLAELPARNAEDDEFERLEKRFIHDHFGLALDDASEENKEAYERYRELGEQRKFLPAAILRETLGDALAKLRLALDPAALMNSVRSMAPLSTWSLRQLRRIDLPAWSAHMIDEFRDAASEDRRNVFTTIAAVDPHVARFLIPSLKPEEKRDLIIEISRFQLSQEPNAAASNIPILMELLRDRENDFIRRAQAMILLAEHDPDPPTLTELTALLVAEIKNPHKGEYGMSTFNEALSALSQLPAAGDHLDLVTSLTRTDCGGFGTALDVLHRLTAGRDDRQSRLLEFVRPRLKESDGMMNDVFLACLAFDLRELAPEIAAYSTDSPVVRDGEGADYSGGNFKGPTGHHYHLAREITALWSEADLQTRGRMWACLIAGRPQSFHPQRTDAVSRELLQRAAAELRELPLPQRRQAIEDALRQIKIPAYLEPTGTWLRSLAEIS